MQGGLVYSIFTPEHTASLVPPCSSNIDVWNIFDWRAGLWWLSRMEFLPYMRGCQLSVWWNVAEYLGCQAINRWGEHSKGANVNNPPSHTWCAPTCCPAAQQQCQFTEYIVPPQSSSECRRAPVSTAASWRGKFQEKGTVQLFSVPPDPAPSPHWCLSALQGAIEGLRVGRGVWGGVGGG